MATPTKPFPRVPSCLHRAERLRAGREQSSPAREMHFPLGSRGVGGCCGVWGACLARGAARPASAPAHRAFPAAACTPQVSAHLVRRYRHKTDMHTLSTRRERGAQTRGMSLCTNAPSALGPAAARAPHFLLHVVVELEFGLVGQLHGPVLQFPAGRGKTLPFCPPTSKLPGAAPLSHDLV